MRYHLGHVKRHIPLKTYHLNASAPDLYEILAAVQRHKDQVHKDFHQEICDILGQEHFMLHYCLCSQQTIWQLLPAHKSFPFQKMW